MKKLLLTFVSTLAAAGIASADHIWLNEFHYDDVGADIGEFVEIAVRTGPVFNVADYSFNFYEGDDGTVQGAAVLLSAFATSGPFSIANSGETITLFTRMMAGIEQGPDGFSLTNTATNTVVFFLSYEGSFMATAGPANGMMSIDIGVAETGATPEGASLGLTGSGDSAAEFSWTVNADDTPGGVNNGQTFAAPIPEPSTYMLLGVGVLICAQQFRRRAKNKG